MKEEKDEGKQRRKDGNELMNVRMSNESRQRNRRKEGRKGRN